MIRHITFLPLNISAVGSVTWWGKRKEKSEWVPCSFGAFFCFACHTTQINLMISWFWKTYRIFFNLNAFNIFLTGNSKTCWLGTWWGKRKEKSEWVPCSFGAFFVLFVTPLKLRSFNVRGKNKNENARTIALNEWILNYYQWIHKFFWVAWKVTLMGKKVKKQFRKYFSDKS